MIGGNVVEEMSLKFVEVMFVHDRIAPAVFSPHISIFGVDDGEKANSLCHATCKIIRSVIDIVSLCLFPTDNHKIYRPDKNRHRTDIFMTRLTSISLLKNAMIIAVMNTI